VTFLSVFLTIRGVPRASMICLSDFGLHVGWIW
jgi:hypothetical protein